MAQRTLRWHTAAVKLQADWADRVMAPRGALLSPRADLSPEAYPTTTHDYQVHRRDSIEP